MAKLSVYDINLLTGQTVTILNLILADNLLNFLPEVAFGSIEKKIGQRNWNLESFKVTTNTNLLPGPTSLVLIFLSSKTCSRNSYRLQNRLLSR